VIAPTWRDRLLPVTALVAVLAAVAFSVLPIWV
jgi:hypothetical protein